MGGNAAARGLTSALKSAVLEHKELGELELAAAGAVAEAEGAVKQASAALDTTREFDQQARTAGDERALKIRLLDARILHAEAANSDEREAVERARTALAQIDRAEKTQVASAAADAIAAEIEASLADNAAEIAKCEEETRLLDSITIELRRRALASKVEELSEQENEARGRAAAPPSCGIEPRAWRRRHRAFACRRHKSLLRSIAAMPSRTANRLALARLLALQRFRCSAAWSREPLPSVSMVSRLREHGALCRRRARTRSCSGSDHRPQR